MHCTSIYFAPVFIFKSCFRCQLQQCTISIPYLRIPIKCKMLRAKQKIIFPLFSFSTEVIEYPAEDDRCFLATLPVTLFLKCQPNAVTTRTTTVFRAGCVRRGLGTPFSRHISVAAAEVDRRSSILQLTNEELKANKVNLTK